MRRVTLVAAGALAFVPFAGAASPASWLTPCTLAGGIEARCGTFRVAEDRSRPDGRRIPLRVAVLPARDGGTRADPVVPIVGGPGGSAVAAARDLLAIFSGLNASRDIVLVDQRGTGGSNRMECPVPRARLDTAAAVRSYLKQCLSGLDGDPRRYTTAPAMDDLAEVLRALGYESVNVYGASYGATAAQYFLGQHPDLVRTVVLDGATLLDVPVFELWGRNGERALKAILERCASSRRCATAYPRVRREAFEVIAALRRKPVRAEGMLIDAATAAGALQSLTLSPAGAAQIPWLAHRARVGDYLPLSLAIEEHGSGAPATRQVMTWAILCNEPWARWSPSRASAASRGTYLAERHATNGRLVAAVCSVMPKAPQPAWSRARINSARINSDRPVLLVVGGADPQDPISNVAGAARTLPNSRTVVVPAAGHTAAQLGCMPRVARQFVERGTASGLDTRCAATYDPPPFALG